MIFDAWILNQKADSPSRVDHPSTHPDPLCNRIHPVDSYIGQSSQLQQPQVLKGDVGVQIQQKALRAPHLRRDAPPLRLTSTTQAPQSRHCHPGFPKYSTPAECDCLRSLYSLPRLAYVHMELAKTIEMTQTQGTLNPADHLALYGGPFRVRYRRRILPFWKRQ
jgi:hypothetical protein